MPRTKCRLASAKSKDDCSQAVRPVYFQVRGAEKKRGVEFSMCNRLFTTVEECLVCPADTFFRIHGTSSRNLLRQYANICVNETKIHFTGLLADAGSGVEDVVVSSK